MDGGLDGTDFEGELAGSVIGEIGLLCISYEWEGREKLGTAHCIPAFRASRCERKRRRRQNSGGWRDPRLRVGRGRGPIDGLWAARDLGAIVVCSGRMLIDT